MAWGCYSYRRRPAPREDNLGPDIGREGNIPAHPVIVTTPVGKDDTAWCAMAGLYPIEPWIEVGLHANTLETGLLRVNGNAAQGFIQPCAVGALHGVIV